MKSQSNAPLNVVNNFFSKNTKEGVGFKCITNDTKCKRHVTLEAALTFKETSQETGVEFLKTIKGQAQEDDEDDNEESFDHLLPFKHSSSILKTRYYCYYSLLSFYCIASISQTRYYYYSLLSYYYLP